MEIAGHPQAWRQVENAKAQMDRVRRLTFRIPKKLSSVIAEHNAIVECLIDRDQAGAIKAMRVHLRGLFRSVEILKKENASYFADDAALAPTPPPRVSITARRNRRANGAAPRHRGKVDPKRGSGRSLPGGGGMASFAASRQVIVQIAAMPAGQDGRT